MEGGAVHLVAMPAAGAARLHAVDGALAPPPPPLLLPEAGFCDPGIAAMHRDSGGSVGALGCWMLPQGTVGGRFLLGHGGRSVVAPDIAPAYVRAALEADTLPDAAHRGGVALRRVKGRVAAIGSLGYETFGHWLLDILPRFWVLRRTLGSAADRLRFAVPDDMPGFGHRLLAAMGVGPDRLVAYARGSEALQADTLVVPSMMHEDYRFHPEARGFYESVVDSMPRPRGLPERLLISRQGWQGGPVQAARLLVNGPELAAALAPLGFVTIRPETLPWPEQVALFAGARVVVGEHGSAMKNLVFAGAGTAVVNMHFLNQTQSLIAALRGHRMMYLDAEIVGTSPDGVLSYRIDPGKLLACAQAAIKAAA